MRVLFEKNGETHIVEVVCVKEYYHDNEDGIAFKAPNTNISEEDNYVWYFAKGELYLVEDILISSFGTGLMDLRNYSVCQIIL